jgi:uncharacterized membrane protein YfcA
MNSQDRFNNAYIVSGVALGGAYAAYKFGSVDKKVAIYIGLGVTLGSLVVAELGDLSSSIPYLLAGGGSLALLMFLI